MGWIWEEEKARQKEAIMKALPETITLRCNVYHRLYIKDGPYELYRFKGMYLRVNRFGKVSSEVNAYVLLEGILRKIRMEQRGQ